MRRLLIAILCAFVGFAFYAAATYRIVPGRMRIENGKPKVEIRRACPCDSLRNARRFRIG